MSKTEILAMRRRGHPLNTIAARFGLTSCEVFKVLHEANAAEEWLGMLYGGERGKVTHPTEVVEARKTRESLIVEAYKSGTPIRQMADQFMCSAGDIYAVLRATDTPLRNNTIKHLTEDQQRTYRKLAYYNGIPKEQAVVAAQGVDPVSAYIEQTRREKLRHGGRA